MLSNSVLIAEMRTSTCVDNHAYLQANVSREVRVCTQITKNEPEQVLVIFHSVLTTYRLGYPPT